MSHEQPPRALGVLGDAEHGPDQDEEAGDVQDVQHRHPQRRGVERLGRGAAVDAHVEGGRRDDEEAEEEDLDAQAAEDDVLALGDVVFGLCGS